jgi:ribonuclease R
MIGSGLFVRFGTVFEGFLPVRRLHDQFYELNELGTQLVGRTTGTSFRLGDAIAVRVESIARNEGKVDLSLAQPSRRTSSS